MQNPLLSSYNPSVTEDRIYSLWKESGFFNPDICIEKGVTSIGAPYFSLVLPPPNVTGTLHVGHASMLAIEDVMVRFARMQGKRTLWIPGTDHAAIATQSKVEKIIQKEEGKNKHDLGREEFLTRVSAFAQESHDTIVRQIEKMGCSLDWSREAFTLDEKRSLAVRTAFKKMYDDSIIYRGHRIVNWDPKGQTTISDDEIVYTEEKTKFYYFQYGPFVIGTSRPETKFGDKYVVMHPDDTRYEAYTHGQQIDIEWINGPITTTVIKDASIDMEFGTGVMTITPWHSTVDFEIAERHNLEKEQIIDKYGKLLGVAGEFAGMKITEARNKIVEKLDSKGLLVKVEDYVHSVATAERTGGIIEPQIMNQWFIDVNKEFPYPHAHLPYIKEGELVTLKKLMLSVVQENTIEILPDRFLKVYTHWIENLRDWCISRQIWYGHRIPVWYKDGELYCGTEAPKEEGWEQDPDTLDTWFSSGLWTFSTLGWPSSAKATQGKPGPENDLANYHPTTILETGYDILFFWVARMILMSTYLVGQVPFKTVYLHGLVRDSQGRKMSKSLGNIIDPLELIEEYGADAVRMSLIIGTAPGNDTKLSPEKVKAYKHFANKLWNISRFVTMTAGERPASLPTLTDTDFKLQEEQNELISLITKEIEEYKFYLAGDKLYHYIWGRFADQIIEESKSILKDGTPEEKASRTWLLYHLLETSIKALHPFMPFVTEELWSILGKKTILMVEPWPHEYLKS